MNACRFVLVVVPVVLLVATDVRAQRITVDLMAERQTIVGNGINLEGYHRSGGGEVLKSKFKTMMNELADDVVRVGMPLGEWEPRNDDARADHIDSARFNDGGSVTNSFRRLQLLQRRGATLWVSVWDVADWLVTNPDAGAQRRVRDLDEFAEAITAYLLRAKQQYGVEPAYVSVNEPSIATENGWGGYQIALTAAEQASLIRQAGERFGQYGLSTKWLIAVHKVYPSEVAYAQAVFEAAGVRPFVAGFDFHGYWFQEGHDPELTAWGKWVETTGLPAFCGECDYDNQFWKRDDRHDWEHGVESGKLLNRAYTLARAAGSLVWYDDVPSSTRGYRYAARHFYEHLTPGTRLVAAISSTPNVLAVAGKHRADDRFALILQNTDVVPLTVTVSGLPGTEMAWIQSVDGSYYQSQVVQALVDGMMKVNLEPGSINTFYTLQADLQ